MESLQQRLGEHNDAPHPTKSARYIRRVTSLVTRSLADIDYFARAPLGWREGTTVVWAGMRGAITVAAAQTLPADTPQRSTLVLIAFIVAGLSLMLQGGTIGALVRRITPPVDRAAEQERSTVERTRLFALLDSSAATVSRPVVNEAQENALLINKQYHLNVISAQRITLLDARDHGIFDADLLEIALKKLDAQQITLEMHGKPVT